MGLAKNLAKMKCVNCHQEILEDNPVQCPYCLSKNLIPIEDEFPPYSQSPSNDSSPYYSKHKHREAMWAVLGAVFLIVSTGLILFGSTQPPNITIGTERQHLSAKVNVFSFLGLLLTSGVVVSWLLWLNARVGKKRFKENIKTTL